MEAQLIKVLLVENDFKEVARFEKLLSKTRSIHFALTRTQRLDETLRLLEQDSFDVIVLDLCLPDSQGLETVALVRSKAILTPILVLTEREDEQLAAKAIGSGAQDYLIKGQVNSPLLAYALRYAIEHTQLLQQLHESEQRYALALKGSQAGVWDWNLTTNEFYLDPSLKAMLGYADKEIQNHLDDWFTLIHPEDRQALTAAVNAYLEELAPHLEIEHRMVHKNGSIRWLLARGTAIRDATGKPYRLTGTDTDITSRKQAQIALDIQHEQVEHVLERERQQLREIIANAPVAIAMFDTQMRCLVHSHKWAIDYGLKGQSIIGRTPCQIFSDIPNHWRAIAQRALNGEVLSQPEEKWERADGSTLYLHWAVQPWSTPEGSVGGVVIATDRINELVEAREAALENSRLKSQFLANMSHEIRTPMNGVLGMTELLGKTDLNPEQLDFVQTLRVSAENLLTLLDDILDFSKLEANEMRLEMQEFDLNRCVENVADLFFTVAQSKSIELAVLIDNNVPRQLMGDAHRLQQILLNLVGNAIKFTLAGEVVIQVSLEFETPTYAEVRFSVTDTGIGIGAADQQKLFQAFSQVDASTTRHNGGTGLGLAICRQLVELMGGEIGVSSRGAAFVPGRWFVKVPSNQRRGREGDGERGRGGEGENFSTPSQNTEQNFTLASLLSCTPALLHPWTIPSPAASTSHRTNDSSQKQGSTFWFTVSLAKQAGALTIPTPALDLVGLRLLVVSGSATIRNVVHSLATFWGMQVEEASNCAEAVTVWRSVESKNQLIDVAIFDLNLLERESDSVRAALALVIQANNWSEGLESLSHNAGRTASGQADLPASSDSKQLKRITKWLLMNSVQERSLALRLMDLGFSGCITKPIKASKLLGCLRQVLTPLDGHQERDRATQCNSVITKSKSTAYRSKVKILLVEDTLTNQKVVLNQLKVLGYEADCAVNGEEALDLLTHCTGLTGTGDWEHLEEGESGRGGEGGSGLYHRRGSGTDGLDALKKGSTREIWYQSLTPTVFPYDIVLMDCQMPVMDGYEATRLLRVFEGESRRTVVIAMTANALVGDREKCIAADMDDYISKPVSLDALEEVLERWIPQRLRDSQNQTTEELELQTKSLSGANSQNLEGLSPDSNRLSTRLKLSSLGDKPLNEVPVDLQRLSELSGGDSEFQRELLEVFLEDAVVYVEELKSALASRDCVTLARRAHQLKGTSATVAIYKMPEVAAQLEHQAQENQLLGASDLLAELEQILKDVQAFIEKG